MPFAVDTSSGALETLSDMAPGMQANWSGTMTSNSRVELMTGDEVAKLDPLFRRAMAALQAADVALYPVQVPGATATTSSDVGVDWSRQYLTTMRSVAAMTGGRAMATGELDATALAKAAQESTAYYRVAYESAPGKNKPFHKLAVKVGMEGAKVLAPVGAQSSPAQVTATRQADLFSALRSTMEFNGLPLTVVWTGTAEEKGKKKAQFSLRIAPHCQVVADDGKLNLDVMVVARTAAGQKADEFSQTLSTTLDPAGMQQIRSEGLNYGNAVLLTPGEYDVRFVVRDAITGKVGAVTSHVKIG